jgi:hypothetical protein
MAAALYPMTARRAGHCGYAPRVPQGSPTLRYLRTLLPTWRFFEAPDVVPQLEVRALGDERWQDALPPLARPLGALWWNGEHTMRLAEHAALDALIEELDGCPVERVPSLPSFRTARALAERHLGEGAARYELRIVVVGDGAPEEVFRSGPLEPPVR